MTLAPATLGLMTKFWAPGRVKTRLGASVGMSAAANIHRQLTCFLLHRLRLTAARRELSFAPDQDRTKFVEWLASEGLAETWSLAAQGSGDLGQRMKRWFQRHLQPQRRNRAILIGSDCPYLTVDWLDQADQALRTHDVVLGPARDGGYYLIGLSGNWTKELESLLSDMPWSQSDLFQATCQRIEAAGLQMARLPESEDVDTLAELIRVCRQFAASSVDQERQLSNQLMKTAGLPFTACDESAR